MSEIQAWYNGLPVGTRYVFTLSAAIPLMLRFNLVSPYALIVDWDVTFAKLQLWRLISPLFLTKLDFNFLMGMYFRYRFSLQLEQGFFSGRTADYLVFLAFVAICLNVLTYFYYMPVLWESFTLAIIYLWSQYEREQMVSFLFGMRFKAMYLPWVLIAFDFFLNRNVIDKILGVIVGHAFYFLDQIYPEMSGRRLIRTPEIFYQYFPVEEEPVPEGTAPWRGGRRLGSD